MSAAIKRKLFNIYNKLPMEVKGASSILLKQLPRRMIFGRHFEQSVEMIRQTEFMPMEALRDRQRLQLKQILLHAFNTTVYYANRFRSKGVNRNDIIHDPINALKKLDFIDKSIISGNYDQFLSSAKKGVRCDYTSTGGTSGEPFYFHINSDRSAKEWGYFVDMWGRVGFTLESKRAAFRGSRIHGDRGYEDDWITHERKFSSFEMTDAYLSKVWSDLSAYHPDFIYAYPSTAISLCQFIERSGKTIPGSVKAVLIGSENVYDGQEEYIEKISKVRVYKWYGHSEKLVLAGECEKTHHYHSYPQYGYIEFIKENGEPAKPGDFAEIVGTGFINTVAPFIRYRTGDFCTYLGDHCPHCGRNYPLFTNVKGRWTQEVLYGKNGNSICMSAINVHSIHYKNVFRYQLYQDTPGKALLKIMPRVGFTEKQKIIIQNELNNKFDGNVEVNAVIVPDIPLTQRGKYNFIDQRCPLKLQIPGSAV